MINWHNLNLVLMSKTPQRRDHLSWIAGKVYSKKRKDPIEIFFTMFRSVPITHYPLFLSGSVLLTSYHNKLGRLLYLVINWYLQAKYSLSVSSARVLLENSVKPPTLEEGATTRNKQVYTLAYSICFLTFPLSFFFPYFLSSFRPSLHCFLPSRSYKWTLLAGYTIRMYYW